MNSKIALFLAIGIIGILIFSSSCTKKQTMDLTPSYKDISAPGELADAVEETVKDIQNGTEDLNETKEQRQEMPMSIPEDAQIYVNPDNLVKKLCTEQVLLGLRSCKNAANGSLNITIKNAGFRNVTMIFYLFDQNSELGYYYSGEPLNAREEKTYTLDLEGLQNTYGHLYQIEATPVLVTGLEAASCLNKKLPVIVSGCG
jgi:hypothetical protein